MSLTGTMLITVRAAAIAKSKMYSGTYVESINQLDTIGCGSIRCAECAFNTEHHVNGYNCALCQGNITGIQTREIQKVILRAFRKE